MYMCGSPGQNSTILLDILKLTHYSAELSLTAGLIHVWQSRVEIKHYSIIIQAQDCNVSRREADLI